MRSEEIGEGETADLDAVDEERDVLALGLVDPGLVAGAVDRA